MPSFVHYQQEGFEWLVFMREQKFGACLADDMGLGKTVQLITYMLHTVNTLQVQEADVNRLPDFGCRQLAKGINSLCPRL